MPGLAPEPIRETRKGGDQEEGAPLWMVTMSDMNTLLMTFFVILFSLMVVERQRYYRIDTDPTPRTLPDTTVAKKGIVKGTPNESRVFSGFERGKSNELVRVPDIEIPQALESRTTRTAGGTVITVGGEFHAFAQGGWALVPEHEEVLRVFLEWIESHANEVLIRGYTAGNLEDSVVREGDRVRSYTKGDFLAPDFRERADHWLLASLRARAVRDWLTKGFSREKRVVRIAPERMAVQVEAYNDPVGDNVVEEGREKNRRVEIVILPLR